MGAWEWLFLGILIVFVVYWLNIGNLNKENLSLNYKETIKPVTIDLKEHPIIRGKIIKLPTTYQVNGIQFRTLNEYELNPEDLEYYIRDQDNFQEHFRPIEQDVVGQFMEIENDNYGRMMEDIDYLPLIYEENRFREFRGDDQNVHDTYVQENLKSSYNKVISSGKTGGEIEELKRYITNSDKTDNDKKKALDNLQDILKRNATVTGFSGKTESEILVDVWNSKDKNVRDQMINELIDTKENGHLVCPVGTTSRIVESLNINEPDKMPKTQSIYREEMLNKAAHFRTQLEQTNEYQEDTFKDKLMNVFYEDYKDLPKEKVDKLVEEWIDYV